MNTMGGYRGLMIAKCDQQEFANAASLTSSGALIRPARLENGSFGNFRRAGMQLSAKHVRIQISGAWRSLGSFSTLSCKG